jgi:predicted RNA polymerase sigma factor
VVALNRAVALAHAEGPQIGLEALDALEADPDATRTLTAYHLLPATRGTLLLQAGRPAEAARALRRALELRPSALERRLLERRLGEALAEVEE